MKREIIVAAAAAGLIVIVALFILVRRRLRKINPAKYSAAWRDLQKYCRNSKTWHRAIIEADKLLDDVLKKRNYKGKSTGERLVAAQHQLSDNETVWFGHKLRNRIVQENIKKITKQETLEALSGFRQALKDLEALQEMKPGASDD